MGLADFLGTDNPFRQFVAQNRGTLGQIGAGLGSGQNLSAGLAQAAQNMPIGRAQDDAYAATQKADAERQQSLNATIEFMRQKGYDDLVSGVEGGGLDMGTAWSEALKRSSPDGSAQDWSRLNDGTLYNKRTGESRSAGDGGAGGGTEYGLTPIYGRFSDGTFGLGVTGKDGTFKPVDTGGFVPNDPRTTYSERAIGTEVGKGIGGAQAGLGAARIVADTTKNAISNLRNNTAGQDEQFGKVLGVVPQQMLPVLPGTNRGNFQVDLSQASGQAFLQAREFLKGQGQITDFESARAESAFSRLQKAAEVGDRASFNAALNDFETAVDAGLKKVEAQAGTGGVVAAPPAGQTSGGVQWSIVP